MQFGHTPRRILQTIHKANPGFGPICMATVNIADGCHRMGLCPKDALRLGMLFPTCTNKPQLIAVLLVLPMGWKESPPAFHAATKTAADIANNMVNNQWHDTKAPHCLNVIAETTLQVSAPQAAEGLPISTSAPRTRPIHQWDIHVNNFLALTQGNKTTQRRVNQALFHSLDHIFWPLLPTDNPHRQEPRQPSPTGTGLH